MPDNTDLTVTAEGIASRLAEALSDPQVIGGVLAGEGVRPVVDVAPVRAEVAVHLRRMRAFDLDRHVDPRDPLIHARRQLSPALRRALEAVEDDLFEWLDGGRERPALFVQNPAAVVRGLTRADGRARELVAAVLPRATTPLSRLSGLIVDPLTIDAVAVDDDAAPASHDPLAKETSAADAVLELGLDQLARVLDGGMVAGVRNRASHVAFDTIVDGQTQQGVLALLLEDASDPRVALDATSPTDTLQVTIGFPEATIQLGSGPLSNPTPVNVGAVEVGARLKLGSQPRAGGTTVNLDLVVGSVTVSTPEGLGDLPLPVGTSTGVRQQLWNAASAEAKGAFAPFYAFAVPLTFDTRRCDIGPRGVAPAFRPGSVDTAPALALFMTLLPTTPTPPSTDAGPSQVPIGADGALLLNNRLVLELACCLLTQSGLWVNLPAEPTEAPTDDNLCCRWRDIGNVSVGEEQFDTLKLLEICAEDGLRMYADLRKSGWGWSARVEITATAELRLDNGVVLVAVNVVPKISTSVAWWVKVLAVLAILGGIALYVIGVWKGNPALIDTGTALVVLGLGLWVFVHLLMPDIRLPTPFDDTDAILDLLPGGLRDKLGTLTFLTDASWDDVALAGFMTVAGEPAPVAGGEVALSPGQALDLDTGEVVSVAEVPLRLDVDLVLHGGLSDAEVFPLRLAPGSAAFPRPPITTLGRTLAAFGSSRLVPLAGRPYAAVAASHLREVIFPAAATAMGVPGRGSSPLGAGAAVFGARSSAGRLAKGVVWTDGAGVTRVRYRTYDTPLLLTMDATHSVQTIGKPGVTDLLTILNARFQAVPAAAWGMQSLAYEWYWQGTRISAMATIDGGAQVTVVGDRCAIDTTQGADLRGALCVVATHVGGTAATACRNVMHIGRIPKPPSPDPGKPGGPPGTPRGPGGPGGFGGP